MSRTRASIGVAATLAAFAALAGCGQRGPLKLPESERPIQRLDKGAAPAPASSAAPPATTAPAPSAEGAQSAPPAGAPRPEDDERDKK
jgi:predicted small lipoprotein YifL